MEDKLASSKTSLHQKISDWIKQEIREKRLQIDDKLPSENELAQQFKVSRLTVRRAMQTLEQENLIIRSQGLGAFVKAPLSRKKMVSLNSFNEDVSQAGVVPKTVLISQQVVMPPVFISALLGLDEGKKVYQLDRLRLGSARPYAYDKTWLPAFYGQLIADSDVENRSIFDILEQDYDITIQKGCQRFDASTVDLHLAEQLDLTPGSAVLLMRRLVYNTIGKPVYYQERYMRTDRFSYEMILERKPELSSTGFAAETGIQSFQPVVEPKNDLFALAI